MAPKMAPVPKAKVAGVAKAWPKGGKAAHFKAMAAKAAAGAKAAAWLGPAAAAAPAAGAAAGAAVPPKAAPIGLPPMVGAGVGHGPPPRVRVNCGPAGVEFEGLVNNYTSFEADISRNAIEAFAKGLPTTMSAPSVILDAGGGKGAGRGGWGIPKAAFRLMTNQDTTVGPHRLNLETVSTHDFVSIALE